MKILLLEDNPERVEWFFESFTKSHFCTTDKPIFAIDFLEMHNNFDRIYLDHDLMPEHYKNDTDCRYTTGLAVAEWLANNPQNNPLAEVIIHSRNWSGVGRMVGELVRGHRKVTAYPFHIMSGLNL